MIIDAHQHFWRIKNGYYTWITPSMTRYYQDYEPAQLKPILDAHGVSGTVLVQAAACIEETEFMLSAAHENNFIKGVVGWVDMSSPNATQDLARLARNPILRGIRPMIQDIKDDKWILDNKLNDAFTCIQKLGLCFDALIFARHIPYIMKRAEQYPDLPIMINHCAKPPIKQGNITPYAAQLKQLAKLPNVYCKLSGLLTEAGSHWNKELLYPYFDAVFEAFGDKRIVFGSDWPVLLTAGNYGDWLMLCRDYVNLYCSAASENIFAKNAIGFYQLTMHTHCTF